ncbi:class I SAM-dependent methyltransferase [Providencia vermicola]|uniref:Class I SAM-dependent methyltransferase n=1 Tax=Providencia stuartii TaxID=588 RepID=A0AAI9MWP7_PROST|nr:class I SAM-dependent methyltransferase [Providencia stuartii]ELR5122596.1 class I SAM-dependent methyltransferase [Providencia stuartii]ELZ5940515.1 class I SAM-dependent methyltransferase [Providencia stuartii]MBG5920578.1 class I SAM-dependent methyltransferase [Providencia stuartii]QIC14271.1 class I SAM-dependent methyltransferase [Providencia vermicola]
MQWSTKIAPALALAKRRVVVKRPDYAEPLAGQKAPSAVITKNHRFDIYPCIKT